MNKIEALLAAVDNLPTASTQRVGYTGDGEMITEMPKWLIEFNAKVFEALPEIRALCGSVAGWKPIETAPHKTSILVSTPSNPMGFESFFDGIVWRCLDGTNGGSTFMIEQPTHWMPLPLAAPPGERK